MGRDYSLKAGAEPRLHHLFRAAVDFAQLLDPGLSEVVQRRDVLPRIDSAHKGAKLPTDHVFCSGRLFQLPCS